MSHANPVLRTESIRTRTIQARVLRVGRQITAKTSQSTGLVTLRNALLKKYEGLLHRLRHLREELHEVKESERSLKRDIHHLQEQVEKLQKQVATLHAQLQGVEIQLASGLTANPALQSLFTSLEGKTVTVTTPAGILSGTVLVVGTNAVELQESNGDIVIIPYSKVSSVA